MRSQGAGPAGPEGEHRHAGRARLSRRVRVLAALAAFVVGAGIALVASGGHTDRPSGATAAAQPSPPTSAGAFPLVQQANWTTLSNSASGLSYQIPPTGWTMNPQIGDVGSVTLAQGAERTAYTCGQPLERLLRGIMGSGSAPKSDPTDVADAVAQAAATLYYTTGNQPPTVAVDPAQPVQRSMSNGTVLHGVVVRAIATQHADQCLGSRGEVLVFVLQFPDHDGVLLVNADVAGGPARPAPASDAELRAIVGTATPTN